MTPARLGNYELLGMLGKGGMAEVYRGRAIEGPHAGQEFALKRLSPALEKDPEALTRFGSEADLSRFLEHPNIVRVHEVGLDGDAYFMVMELIEGRDVGQVIRRCRKKNVPWPIDFAVYLTQTLLEALSYAHTLNGPTGKPLGIVHCDIGPSNFFVSRTGELKLGDFGVARLLMDGGAKELMGKPYYLSPEALEGQISPAVDLWAATVMFYELLTLARPFSGNFPDDVFEKIRKQEFTPVRELRADISPELEQVVERAFASTPDERFASAREYADALTGLYDERVGTPLAISSVVRGLFAETPHSG
jgi:serine/threonine-protein kinase